MLIIKSMHLINLHFWTYLPELSNSFHSRGSAFFSFSSSPLKKKNDEGKEFMIAEGTAKVCSLHLYISSDFRLIYLIKCVSDRP